MSNVIIPAEPPAELANRGNSGDDFDETLFDLCRNDDYAGLYREFVKRFGKPWSA